MAELADTRAKKKRCGLSSVKTVEELNLDIPWGKVAQQWKFFYSEYEMPWQIFH